MKIKQSELKQIIQEELQKIKEGKESLVVDNNGNVYGGIRNLFQEAAGDGIPAPSAKSAWMLTGSDDAIIDLIMKGHMISGFPPDDMFEDPEDAKAIVAFYKKDPKAFNQKVGAMFRTLDSETQEKVIKDRFEEKFRKALNHNSQGYEA